MPSKLKKAIGAVKDQTSIGIAKVASNNSSNLEVAVLKATTHDDLPVDNRYVQEVLHLVSADKAYAAACARAISKRIGRTRNWIVTLKSLVLVLRIFQDGDPYFPREVLHAMKRGAKILNLSSFRDDSNSSPWDFTAFVRTFALYLDERLDCFLTGKLQRRFTHRLSENPSRRRPDEPVREMKPVMLLDRIGHWQRLLERAIATRPTGAAKSNRLVQIALYAVVEESFDLYKDISDGLSLILDNFFNLEHQSGVVAFQTCMRAAKQYEELMEFYDLCKSMGVGRTSEYPSIQKISEELIETLQEFLKDQSSFPVHAKSPNNHPSSFLLPPTTPRRSRHNSFDAQFDQFSVSRGSRRGSGSYGGMSDISVATDGSEELGSTSLEDLLSATLTTGKNPAISIDLETYSQRDENFMMCESGSAKSLPASSSFADLLSLDDWNGDEEIGDLEEAALPSKGGATTNNVGEIELNNAASTGWELVLFETPEAAEAAQPPPVDNNSKFVSNYDDLDSLFDQVSAPLPPPNTTTTLNSLSLDALYNQSPISAPRHYNPFLQDDYPTTSSPIIQSLQAFQATPENSPFAPSSFSNNEFSSAPTFQAQTPTSSPEIIRQNNEFLSSSPTFQASATPTFQASQQPPGTPMQNDIDPFATRFDDQMFSSSNMSPQNMMQEQQLWLQNQNKIIAKHMS